jgi:hypothetical protein
VEYGFVRFQNANQIPCTTYVPSLTWPIASPVEVLAEAEQWLLAEPLFYWKGNDNEEISGNGFDICRLAVPGFIPGTGPKLYQR